MKILIPVVFLHGCGILLKTKWNMDRAESYLIALMGAAAVLYVGGIVNLLWPVTAAVFLCILIGLIVTVKKGRSRGMSFAAALRLKEYFDPLVILHAISCLVFTVIFRVSEPLFYYWDEIAFWGTSAKSVKLMDRLYSVWPTTLHNHLPPANALLSYFFSFFAADFQPYFLLLSYAFLFFAVYAAVAELAYRKSGSLPFAVATYILLVLSPFMCVAHKEGLNYQTLLYAYGTAMVDFNIAVVFLSIVVLYLRNPAGKWYLLPCIFLVNMKNTGAFFAVLAMCVVVCFTLFDAQAKKRIRKAVKTGGIMLAVIAISYASWFVHLNAFEPKAVQQVVLQDKAYLLQQQEEPVRPDKAVGRNVLSIVVPSLRSGNYNHVMGEMRKAFLLEKTNLFLPDRYFVPILIAAGLLAALLFPKGNRHRALLVSSGIAAGCYIYGSVISFFIAHYPEGIVEYPRYMSSYYFLWFYTIVLLFVMSEKRRRIKQAIFCAVSLVALCLIGKTGLDYTAVNAPDTPYLDYMETEQRVQPVCSVLKKDDRVYLVVPDQATWEYISYRYHLLPAVCNHDTKGTGIDFSIGFREALDPDSDRQYYNIASPEAFAQLMTEYFDYVYVVEPDKEFAESYARLFSDGMTEGALYRVTDGEIPMQVV